jgi:hypothetical protein
MVSGVVDTGTHALPVYTRISGTAVLKYSAPVSRAFPSLSTVGLLDFAPR